MEANGVRGLFNTGEVGCVHMEAPKQQLRNSIFWDSLRTVRILAIVRCRKDKFDVLERHISMRVIGQAIFLLLFARYQFWVLHIFFVVHRRISSLSFLSSLISYGTSLLARANDRFVPYSTGNTEI